MRWRLVSTSNARDLPIRQALKQQLIKTLGDEQAAIIPQGFLTEIVVRFTLHAQSMSYAGIWVMA